MQQQELENTSQRNLHRLNSLEDYKVHANDPDVRGWTVKTSDHRTLGRVDSLIADTETKEVRYLEVNIDDAIANNEAPLQNKQPGAAGSTHVKVGEGGKQHLIVPIGSARVKADTDEVIIDSIKVEKLHSAPRIEKDEELTPGYELDLRKHFFDPNSDTQLYKRWEDRRNTTDRWGDSFYNEKYSADRFYQHRRGN